MIQEKLFHRASMYKIHRNEKEKENDFKFTM